VVSPSTSAPCKPVMAYPDVGRGTWDMGRVELINSFHFSFFIFIFHVFLYRYNSSISCPMSYVLP
jgi:hypothetical protein